MIFFIHKIRGDISGHYDQCFIVDSHHPEITKELLDLYEIPNVRADVEYVNENRWIEMTINKKGYASLIIFNDMVDSDRTYRIDEIENIIKEYKIPYLRDEKLKEILEK